MRLFSAILTVFLLAAVSLRAQTFRVATSATTYAATGGTVTFSVSLAYPEPLASAGIALRAPPGWSFQSSAGAGRPQIGPGSGTTGMLEFAYTNVPASPVEFSITVAYPAGLSGNQVFSDIAAILRPFTGARQDLPHAALTLVPAGGGGGGGGGGTAPVITLQPAGRTANPGETVEFSVAATGTAPLAYQWRKDGADIAGQTGAMLRLTAISAGSAGRYSVVVSNPAGSVVSVDAVLAVRAPPHITRQPASTTVTLGATATFTVEASSPDLLTYSWRKDGVAIPGATTATLRVTADTGLAAGTYSVIVSSQGGSVTSAGALLVVQSPQASAPRIVTQPAAATSATEGGTVALSVVASGDDPFVYSWRKDGVPLPGQTTATLRLVNVQPGDAGTYTVLVSNTIGSVVSSDAIVTVQPAGPMAGARFGELGGAGSFALYVRPDRTGIFVAYVRAARMVLVASDIVVDTTGRFRATAAATGGPAAAALPGVAASAHEYNVEGTIAPNGAVAGSVTGLSLDWSAPAPATGGSAALAGYYRAAAAGGSTTSHVIIGAAGDVFVATLHGTTADAGRGTVTAAGALAVTTEANASIAGAVAAHAGTIALNVASGAGGGLTLLGGNDEVRTEREHLVNISTRSQTGSASASLIAGFVITGRQPKPVLVRAVGPTLGSFGVGTPLAAPKLEVFRDATLVAAGGAWSTSANAAAIADAAVRVGAFALPADSRDAALLISLSPGAYTAVVGGEQGGTGVSLIEVYDATSGALPRDQRIINISTRAFAGGGEDVLIAGFVINGSLPKRVLVRGAGPALTPFGVAGALARPQLTVFSAGAAVAQNAGWGRSADAAAIAGASARVGAFAFPAGSDDAAVIINLAPGAYTAQVAGAGDATGIALLEVYEVP